MVFWSLFVFVMLGNLYFVFFMFQLVNWNVLCLVSYLFVFSTMLFVSCTLNLNSHCCCFSSNFCNFFHFFQFVRFLNFWQFLQFLQVTTGIDPTYAALGVLTTGALGSVLYRFLFHPHDMA